MYIIFKGTCVKNPDNHRNKHGGKFRSTASDMVLNNKKTLFAVGIEFLK